MLSVPEGYNPPKKKGKRKLSIRGVMATGIGGWLIISIHIQESKNV